MNSPRYPEELKIEAIKQVTERGLPVADVAGRLGVSTHSLYAWIRRYSKPEPLRRREDDQQAELRRLRAELKRATEERDILKRPPRTLPRALWPAPCCPVDGSARAPLADGVSSAQDTPEAGRHWQHQTAWHASSTSPSRTRSGLPISPTSALTRADPTWRS